MTRTLRPPMSSVSLASALVEMPCGYQSVVLLVVGVPGVGVADSAAEEPRREAAAPGLVLQVVEEPVQPGRFAQHRSQGRDLADVLVGPLQVDALHERHRRWRFFGLSASGPGSPSGSMRPT